jgi:hypothetical protein
MVAKRSTVPKAVQKPTDLDPAQIEEKSKPLRDSSANEAPPLNFQDDLRGRCLHLVQCGECRYAV